MNWFGAIDLAIVAVAALGLGGWQLWSVNREIRRDRKRRGDGDEAR